MRCSPLSRTGFTISILRAAVLAMGSDGAMTEFVRVPERCLHRLPAALPFEKAALTEPCCVAYNAVCVNGRVRPGDTVLVLGPGPIGLLCANMAKLSGAGTVIVAGLPADTHRLRSLASSGQISLLKAAWSRCRPNRRRPWRRCRCRLLGRFRHAADRAQSRRPAGQIIKVGWGPQPLQFSLDPLVQKNVTISGSFSHNWPVWERVISMIVSGQIDLTPVISRIAGLDRLARVLRKNGARRVCQSGVDPLMPPLNISAFPKCYLDQISTGQMSVFEWIEMSKQLDCDGLEMYSGFFPSFEASYLDRVGEAIASAGFVMPMFCCSPDFTHPDPDSRRREVEREANMIAVTRHLGGERAVCRILSGQRYPECQLGAGKRMGRRSHSRASARCQRTRHRARHGESL